jgi:membrane protein DedA with SNARE-associated domain
LSHSRRPAHPGQVRAKWVLVLIGALATSDAIGAALSPYLLVERPLALLALNADDRHVVLMAGRVDYWAILVIAIPRRTLTALAVYGFGAFYGRRAIAWASRRSSRAARLAAWIERLLSKVGAPLLIVMPGYTLGLLSGVTRMPLRKFVLFHALGQVALLSADYFLGSLIAVWTDRLLELVAVHVLELTAFAATIVLTYQVIAWCRRRRAAFEQPQ